MTQENSSGIVTDARRGGPSASTVPTWQVLHEEFAHLHRSPLQPLDHAEALAVLEELAPSLAGFDAGHQAEKRERGTEEARYRKNVHALPGAGQTALCLSGGGIRSAAFCLGVLQGLARRGLLGRFNYLSTVSGGGYIGSWLTAWTHRVAEAGGSFASVEERVANPADLTATVAGPIDELRRKQQYITPRSGLLSADTWAALALVQRDLLLNWLVFVPLIVSVLLVPRILEWALTFWGYYARDVSVGGGSGFGFVFAWLYALVWPPGPDALKPPGWKGLLDVVGACVVLCGIAHAIGRRVAREPNAFNDRTYVVRVMLPVVVGGLMLVFFLAPIAVGGSVPDTIMLVEWMAGTLITFLAARLWAAWMRGPRVQGAKGWKSLGGWKNLGIECLALAGAGSTAGLLIWSALWLRISMDLNARYGLRDMAAFGVPVLLLAYLVGQSVYAGLTSHSRFGRIDREWLARASSYYLLWALVWAVGASLVLFGPDLISFTHAILVAAGIGVMTLGTASSSLAKATTALAAAKERFPVTKLTQAVCLVFVAAGTIVLSHVTVRLLAYMGFAGLEGGPALAGAVRAAGWPVLAQPSAVQACGIAGHATLVAFGAALSCLACSLAASFFVDVNTFSLHALYEARLVRTFLGASNIAGVAAAPPSRNRFTDFSDTDDIRMSELRPSPGSSLFPVLGMALNLVRADNLAWQERKAGPFIATPFRVGSHLVGYRGPTPEMTLGTAMAISGAAASPNWGYHSSPLVGFVMMLFNIRLGQWLLNPCYPKLMGTKYRSFRLMLQEAFGQTTDTDPNVYVSDGGHFDNLGLYEMLRRRCRIILVVDASQDERMTFEDLGATLRKAAVDLGVTVDLGPLGMTPRSDPLAPGVYAAVGRILYPEGRTRHAGWRRARGTMIYIKPGAYADVPADVRAYAASNAAFPHDSTVNQFFTESQFESYRTLGSHVVGRIFGKDGGGVPMISLPIRAARYVRSVVK